MARRRPRPEQPAPPPGTPRRTPDGRPYVPLAAPGYGVLWLPEPAWHGDPVYAGGRLAGRLVAALGGWGVDPAA